VECVHSVANEGAFKHDSLSFALKKEIVFQFHKALHFCKVWSYDHKLKSENGEISNENVVHIGSCSTPLFNQLNQLPKILQGFQSK